jgi:hypothetical protein
MNYASDNEHIRDDVRKNDKGTNHCYAIRLLIIITGFFSKGFSPKTP